MNRHRVRKAAPKSTEIVLPAIIDLNDDPSTLPPSGVAGPAGASGIGVRKDRHCTSRR